MLDWTDTAIALSARKHAETSAIVRVLSREHGVYSGLVKGISGKANRGMYQAGNLLIVSWKARLSEQIGMFRAEPLEMVAAHAMQNGVALSALTSATALTEILLPERAPYVDLFTALSTLALAIKHDHGWLEMYARFELALLAATGYRLDLSRCAGTGTQENLIYVSPKSGRAVCAEAGKPFHDKLFRLPPFLLSAANAGDIQPQEILDSLRLTGYFLQAWVLEPNAKTFPAARARLMNTLTETKEIA